MIERVLMTADAVGGVWTYALELSRALAARGVSTLLAVMGPAPTAEKSAAALSIPHLRLEHQPFALEWMEHPWADVWRAGDWLLELERKWEPQIVHLNGFAHASRAFKAPAVVVAHSCVCSWHEAVAGGPLPTKWSGYRHHVTAGLRAAHAVIAPTRWMLDALERHYGDQPRAWVIGNARSAAGYQAGEKEPFVLSAGRVWDEAKNLLTLDQAAQYLSWPVAIAGAATAQGRRSPVTFSHASALGELEPRELAGLLSRAAIYALPARYEPFGLSVLEAALSGCALVLGDIGPLRELWDGAALFVEPQSPRQLASAIERLIESPTLRFELARRAGERAAAMNPEAQAAAYSSVYRSVTDFERRAACAS